MSKLDEFVELVKDIVSGGRFTPSKVGESRYYFGEDYFDEIAPKYESRAIGDTKELHDVNNHPGVKKICSVSSSARLCFHYFYSKGANFEIALPNPVGGNPAQLDAKLANTYYECKCQEVILSESQSLKSSYKDLLIDEFAIKNITTNIYEDTLSFNLRDMGANYDEDYDKTHFNTKQLFTHLLAIAKAHPSDEVTLKYVIFKPNDKYLAGNNKLVKVYDDLRKEIDALVSSRSIIHFLRRHPNIKLDLDSKNSFVDIEDPQMLKL